jgi:pimeloyl-ACP methyl ester carboxylesterase
VNGAKHAKKFIARYNSDPMDSLQFACTTASSRRVTVNGLSLHMLEWAAPGAPGLCFLHGGAAHSHWFDGVVAPFVGRYHIISLDQRGHGSSEWSTPPAYATEDFVSDLVGVMDGLGWPRMTVVGHSMGGANAMALSAWHPARVDRLVIADSRPSIPPERLGVMHERGERALRTPRRHPSPESAVASFRLLPRDTVADPALLAHVARAGIVEREGGWSYRFDPAANGSRRPHDMWAHLSRITAPTLLVRAALSPVLNPEMATSMRNAIPNVRFVEVPGAYHHVTLDRPKEFVAAVSDFLL